MAMADYSKKPLTQKQRYNHFYVMDAMRRFEWDMHHTIAINNHVPQEWHEISTRRDQSKKKVCLRVDEDVLKWFKSMGPGYQPRINDVLRSFMHMKLMGLLMGDETLDQFREGRSHCSDRPDWGKTEQDVAEIRRDR